MQAVCSILALLLSQSPPETPIDRALKAITPETLGALVGALAGDDFEGRCAGFPGNDKAANYVAARMKEAKLAPVGDVDVLGGRTYFQVFLFDGGRRMTRNCVGLLEGADPDLRSEIVVIGAHFDGLGMKGQHRGGQMGRSRKDDIVWNGADDNASGTATVLAILKAFADSGVRPRRSVLFMGFGAEEWGLFGSRWYVDHPVFPLEKTVAMINLDMTGRTDDESVGNCSGLGTVAGDVFRPVIESAMKTTEGFRLNLDPFYGGGSDHAPFADRKIPICWFREGGPCADYHRVSDHADRLHFPYMAKIARAAAAALVGIADLPERPLWNPDFKLPEPPKEDDGWPKLGIHLAALDEDETEALGLGQRGAMRVMDLVADGIALSAGVRRDDVLSAFDGTPFDGDDPRGTLVELLKKVVRGREYVIEIYRDGKRFELKVTWPRADR